MECLVCNKEVSGSGVKYCSDECKKEAVILKNKNNFIKTAESLKGIENVDYVVCKWCNSKVKRIYGIHIKNHHSDKTINDYKKEFPDSLTACISDKKATSKNAGQHMKTEDMRKLMSDKIKGSKNPNHKSKTTEKERKERSPFSDEFYKSRGVDIDKKKEFINNALNGRLSETQYEYWLNKYNGDIDTAKKSYKERQRTFTLEKCIAKYGEELGKLKYEERQLKWQKNLYKNFAEEGDGRSPQSKWAKEIINHCCEFLGIEVPKKEKWISSKNLEYRFSYDFTHENKIIEFNGDFWHGSPLLFKPDDIIPVLNITANEKHNMDKTKIELAKSKGYEVLVIWESDYKKNPNDIINKCINFINE